MLKSIVRAAAPVVFAGIASGESAAATPLYVSYPSGVYTIDASGNQSLYAGGLSYPIGIAFDAAGDLYVVNAGDGSLRRIAPDTTRTTVTTSLDTPVGMAVDSAGNVFVADSGISTGHSAIYEFTPAGTKSTFANNLGSLAGLAFDTSGNLYAATGSTVTKLTSAGDATTYATGFTNATGLAFDAAGNLFVANHVTDGSISEVSPAGTVSTFAATTDLESPYGLAFNSAGALFVSESRSNQIEEFSADGQSRVLYASTGTNVPQYIAFAPVPEPASLAVMGIAVSGLLLRRRRHL